MVIRKGIKGTAKLTGKAVKGTAKLTGKAVKGTTKLGLSAARGKNPLKRQEVADIASFNQEVVGESSYWKALNSLVGRKRDASGSYWHGEMFISHDKRNKFDRYAIRVQAREINYVTVGYLPANEANKDLIEFLDGERLPVPARVAGGRELQDGNRSNYGVTLAMTSETLNGYEWKPTKQSR